MTAPTDPAGIGCPTCRTILRPFAVAGGCADEWHAENAPADPAGLDAAVLAMRRARNIDPTNIPAMARAAAPHIRRAVLLEAADEVDAMGHRYAARRLRERAERETS